MKNVTKVLIEAEGEVNGFFTVHFGDGKVQEGWSCDQGSIEWDDENFRDPEVEDLCMSLWWSMDIDNDYNGRSAAVWHKLGGLSETVQKPC